MLRRASAEETIDVHGELAGPVDDVSLLFDVTSAITDEPADTITIELIDVDNVQTRPIEAGEGGANGSLSGCAEGRCSFDAQLRFVRAQTADEAVLVAHD